MVYSIARHESFKSIDEHIHAIQEQCVNVRLGTQATPTYLCGNKCDLASDRVVSYDDLI